MLRRSFLKVLGVGSAGLVVPRVVSGEEESSQPVPGGLLDPSGWDRYPSTHILGGLSDAVPLVRGLGELEGVWTSNVFYGDGVFFIRRLWGGVEWWSWISRSVYRDEFFRRWRLGRALLDPVFEEMRVDGDLCIAFVSNPNLCRLWERWHREGRFGGSTLSLMREV